MFFFILILILTEINFIFTRECQTQITIIHPETDIGKDNKKYLMINILGFVQNATSVECLANQSCEKGTCQQDYKLHQFLTVPHGKSQFELHELQYRFFYIPYGCKCTAE